jgi:hypothetical protein
LNAASGTGMDSNDGDTITPRYESLRDSVAHPTAGAQDLRGLAVLLRQGTAAWMHWARAPSRGAICVPADADTMPRAPKAPWPEGIDPLLVHIVTAMALAHAKEACV